jgi:hypothetical protein
LADSMKKLLMFVPPAALAALLAPALVPHKAAAAADQPQVQPALVLAAVESAEAQRRAAAPVRPAPGAAAALDKAAGAAEKIDPARVDPDLAANALAH